MWQNKTGKGHTGPKLWTRCRSGSRINIQLWGPNLRLCRDLWTKNRKIKSINISSLVITKIFLKKGLFPSTEPTSPTLSISRIAEKNYNYRRH